jgi:hypothetical protein
MLPRLKILAAIVSKIRKAIAQRKKLVTGGTIVCIIRPTTALPAHSSGANTSKKMVPGVSL